MENPNTADALYKTVSSSNEDTGSLLNSFSVYPPLPISSFPVPSEVSTSLNLPALVSTEIQLLSILTHSNLAVIVLWAKTLFTIRRKLRKLKKIRKKKVFYGLSYFLSPLTWLSSNCTISSKSS